MRGRRHRYAAWPALLLAAALLTGCSDEDAPGPSGPAGTAGTGGAPSPTASAGPGAPLPEGGTAASPASMPATSDLLDWREVPGPVEETVTRSGAWTLTVAGDAGSATLDGPGTERIWRDPDRRVSAALLDGRYAVVVLEDRREQQTAIATVVDLETGEERVLDGRSPVPTTNGGTWALGPDRLVHATTAEGRAYCLASVDLAAAPATASEVVWCAPERQGFNAAHLTPAGLSVLTFDDSRPACRTVVALAGGEPTPFPGVPDCRAWEGLVTDEGAVWSVIPDEQRVEAARLRARVGDAYYDLGPGTAGTLVWCAGAAWFARDPQRQGEPARLMRFSAEDGLSIAYESPGGQAFLTEPRCGGEHLTVTALAEAEDEQVTAPLG